VIVFDASALLAFLQAEPGASEVDRLLETGGVCGAANWSEIAQKVMAAGADWPTSRDILLSYPLSIEPLTIGDAELGASMWRKGSGLSLADRLCLALGRRLDADIITTDREWANLDRVMVIR